MENRGIQIREVGGGAWLGNITREALGEVVYHPHFDLLWPKAITPRLTFAFDLADKEYDFPHVLWARPNDRMRVLALPGFKFNRAFKVRLDRERKRCGLPSLTDAKVAGSALMVW